MRGVYMINTGNIGTVQPAITILQNVIIWVDGTIRPWRGHNQCTGRWKYDGQVKYHDCSGLREEK